MAYTKLQLENFKSAWTVEEVDHIEQGILANESALTKKQDILVSGQNIKTVNGLSLVGSGDVDLSTLGYLTIDGVPNANWATNDINNVRYIFNRPFYSEYTDSAIQNEITYTTNKTMSNSFNVSTLIEEGKDYKVIFDGIEYYCTAKSSETEGWIGNGSLINATYSNTGEPFGVKYLAPTPTTSSITVYSTAGTHSFYLGEITNETIHHLPDKYLSDKITNNLIIDLTTVDFPEITEQTKLISDEDIINLFKDVSTNKNIIIKMSPTEYYQISTMVSTEDGYLLQVLALEEEALVVIAFGIIFEHGIACQKIIIPLNTAVLPEETIENLYNSLV